MQRYNFIRRESARTYTDSEIAKAAIVSDIAEIVNLSTNASKFEFAVNEDLTKALKDAKTLSIRIETLSSGKDINRGTLVLKDGKEISVRIWNGKGKDTLISPQSVTAKGMQFGYCKQDADLVTETRVNGSTGELKRYPVIYADCSALA